MEKDFPEFFRRGVNHGIFKGLLYGASGVYVINYLLYVLRCYAVAFCCVYKGIKQRLTRVKLDEKVLPGKKHFPVNLLLPPDYRPFQLQECKVKHKRESNNKKNRKKNQRDACLVSTEKKKDWKPKRERQRELEVFKDKLLRIHLEVRNPYVP